MKRFALTLCVAASIIFATAVFAAEQAGPSFPNEPTSELRTQDSAFLLLIESFRELQTYLIEADYDKRLKLASKITDCDARKHILTLAAQEHDQRLAQLREKLSGFDTAYDASRHAQEKKAGGSVPVNVDPQATDAKLRSLVPFTPKQLGHGEDGATPLLPTGAQMIYGPRR